jgi:dipeptidyl aminopeptidase/acylaminoacyl peptidase
MRSSFPALLLCALLLAATAVAEPTGAQQPALQPLTAGEAFGGGAFADPQLSPDGRYLALLADHKGRMSLNIYDLERGRYESHVGYSNADVAEPRWLGSSQLLFTLTQRGQSASTQHVQGGLYVTTRDGRTQRKLHHGRGGFLMRGLRRMTDMRPLQVVQGSEEEFIAACDDVDEHSVDLYRVNAATGKRVLLTGQRPPGVQEWVLDARQQPRVAISAVAGRPERVVHLRAEDGTWRELWRYRLTQGDIRHPVSVEADGKLLVATNEGRDTMVLREYEPATGRWGEVLVEHPQSDVAVDATGDAAGALLRHESSGELLGVRIDAMRPVFAWMDARRQKLQALVDAALPGRINALQFSSSPWVFVTSRSDTERARWYLLHGTSGELRSVLSVQPGLDPGRVPPTEDLILRSRDGLTLFGHVLRPPQASPGTPLPTIVLVHGGPWARGAVWGDSSGDMARARWLASRGYLVVLPGFRGGTGFGKRLLHAARGQIGRAMQDDIDDAVDALVRRGDADPARLCIMGGSYGGYASLMAVARSPDRYRCAVAGFPVSDLVLLLTSPWGDISRHEEARVFWIDMVGDPAKDRAALEAVSPRFLAARIRAKVMIHAGMQDDRTPLEQAEVMRDALEQAGNPPLWLAKHGEGHGYRLASSQAEWLALLEPFLAAQLAPLRTRP